MSAHKHWRVLWESHVAAGAGFTQFMELAFKETAGGSAVSGTPIFSTQFASSGQFSAAAAFDGGTTEGWSSTNGPNYGEYLGLTFSVPKDIVEVVMTGWVGNSEYALKSGWIQWSDDLTNWHTVKYVSGQTGWGQTEARTFGLFTGTISGSITEGLDITKWVIFAVSCATGQSNGFTISTGSTYLINIERLEPCHVFIAPWFDYAWSAGKSVAVGDIVVAANPDGTPHLWICNSGGSGTTGGTEPTWNLSGTTTDNTVTWTYLDPLVDPVALGPKIPVAL
jgi:hypothetical protein